LAGYPEAGDERRIGFEALRAAVARIFAACGMDQADSFLVADSLAWADLRGIHSHGVLRVPEYVKKLHQGGIDPRGRPGLAGARPGAVVVDGGNAMGQVVSRFAMECALDRAVVTGVAAAAARGSNHCGALAYYAVQALERGMIGVATTNALPTMAPWGGLDKIVGINPLAVAIPAGEESSVVLDCAFSYSSHGKIRVFHQKGASIPPNWAFDRSGRPTTDPAEAIEGLLQPIGEYKGVGLAIVFGLLSTALSGASYGTDLGNMIDGPRAGADGHFFLAIDVASFTDPVEFGRRVDRVVRQIRESRAAQESAFVCAPGAMEAELERRYRAGGIPLNEFTIAGIEEAGRLAGVSLALHRFLGKSAGTS
jgi:LDH2 family malate/lactate/ureidoglycolate dehydrogenase